ncbi:MAG: hypothetical protein HKN46_00905 [Acidimicrobiia bacterium]|nr:hypothetical protein [Acidimicrobiia bacterium]
MRRAWLVLAICFAASCAEALPATPPETAPPSTATTPLVPSSTAPSSPAPAPTTTPPAAPGISIPDLLEGVLPPPTTPAIIGIAPTAPTTPSDLTSTVVDIPGCQPYEGILSSLVCTDRVAYGACLEALGEAMVGDCRGVFPHEFNPASSPVYEEVVSPPSLSTSSSLAIEVFSGERGGGSLTGTASAQLLLDVPEPPAATSCAPGCPTEVCGVDYCSRSCESAQGWNTALHGEAAGIPVFTGLGTGSCAASVAGGFSLTGTVHLLRAWEACQRSDRWGATTEIVAGFELGKAFIHNNPTVASTTASDGDSTTVSWSYENPAQVWLRYVVVEFPVEVTCRISRSG